MMEFYIKKIKSREGVNSVDVDKVKKGIPEGYKAGAAPTVTFTANHVVVSFKLTANGKSVKKSATRKAK